MNGEISLTSFTTALLTLGNHNDEITYQETLVNELINGQVTDFVYNTLSISDRREHGVFFSGPKWAEKILSGKELTKWHRFVDPSVGVGDLLLEVCKSLPLKDSISLTLEYWAEVLVAIDLRKSFLEITWIRIQAFAMYRHKIEKQQSCNITFKELPKSFIVGDALSTELELRPNDCVVMNPPYQRIVAASHSFVGKGKRSAAALHLEHVLLQAPPGVGIFALVPDVLRSGSSYKRFRLELGRRASVSSFSPFGAFGSQADIDVAILVATTKKLIEIKDEAQATSNFVPVVGDFFDVSVGSVVPHRTLSNGKSYGYLTAKNALIGAEITSSSDFATYISRLEKGPFVIVRRTSSPRDKKRARSTLIKSENTFLVENHLLILKPKDNAVISCYALMRVLSDKRTDEWLNHHIRCRHLTVGAIKNLPWIP